MLPVRALLLLSIVLPAILLCAAVISAFRAPWHPCRRTDGRTTGALRVVRNIFIKGAKP